MVYAGVGGAQHAASVHDEPASSNELPIAEPEFLKGKRRKKGADKSVLAMKPGGRGLTVVGDDAQSISFRAAA